MTDCLKCLYYTVCPEERLSQDYDCFIEEAPLRKLQADAITVEAYIQRTKDYVLSHKLKSNYWKKTVNLN